MKFVPTRIAGHLFTRPGFGKAKWRNFRYEIVYRVNEKQITVMIIRHEKRHPRHGMSRLRS